MTDDQRQSHGAAAAGAAPGRYSADFRADAVRMVLDLRARSGQRHGAIQHVADQLGCGAESLRLWVRQAEIDAGHVAGTTTDEHLQIRALRNENRQLRRANAILQAAAVYFSGERRRTAATMVGFIDLHRETFGVEAICEVLQMAPSTYYSAKGRQPSARRVRDDALKVVLLEIWERDDSIRGLRGLWRAMVAAGHDIGRDQTGRLMRELGIRGRPGRRPATGDVRRSDGAPFDGVDDQATGDEAESA